MFMLSELNPASIAAGIALGGAAGTALAGAWRNKALSLWRQQAEALAAQNQSLRERVDELTNTVSGLEGEMKHLRTRPDYEQVAKLITDLHEHYASTMAHIVATSAEMREVLHGRTAMFEEMREMDKSRAKENQQLFSHLQAHIFPMIERNTARIDDIYERLEPR